MTNIIPTSAFVTAASHRGAAQLIRVIDKTDFAFDGRASGSAQNIVLAEALDSSNWKSGVLIVRFHALSGWTASAQLAVIVQNVALTAEEPPTVFPGSGIANQRYTSSIGPGYLDVGQMGTPIGPQLQVALQWTQGITAASGSQTCSISIDLLGRPR